MKQNNRTITVSELKDSKSFVTGQKEFKFDHIPIIIPLQLDNITSCAFNPQNTLLLVYGFLNGMSVQPDQYSRQIYTSEGYYVTSIQIHSDSIDPSSNMMKFSDHFILNFGFDKLVSYHPISTCTQFVNFGITRHNEYNVRRIESAGMCKTIESSFLDCDKNGNIYLISEIDGSISVYDSDLKFTCDLELDRRETGVIVAINIHYDYLIILEYVIGGRVIHKFSISTYERIDTVQIDSYQVCNPNRITFDEHKNILIYNASPFDPSKNYSKSVSVLYEDGKIGYYTLPGLNESEDKSDKESHLELLMTEDYQLISVMHPGYILIYTLV